ncbi:MAG TPA: CDP-alcohol phosphatidyltransferase family protein [Ktedonobacterales bacterium]|jgi:phosphatidylglycerophosphate synthase
MPRNEFVITLLTDLRQRRYSPAAWGRFLADSWRQSRATAQAHSRLSRSWARVSLLLALLAVGVFSLIWLLEGEQTALRLLPALLICLALQQGDVYVHLGLNRSPTDGLLCERLGLPTTLTLVRGLMAGCLLAHLLSGAVPPNSFTLGALLIGTATDIADGRIARRTNWQTRLGGYLDSEADLYLSTSATLCALRAGVLPAWATTILLLRFAIPLIGALFSYFVAIRQVDLTHTVLGRSAGAAQSMLLIAVLAPKVLAPIIAPIYLPLLLVTLALVALAPVVEISKNLPSLIQ